MESIGENINLVLTIIIGVSSSIFGNFLYLYLKKIISKLGVTSKNNRIISLNKNLVDLEELFQSTSKTIIYCFRSLFGLLYVSFFMFTVLLAGVISFETLIYYNLFNLSSVLAFIVGCLQGVFIANAYSKIYKTYSTLKQLSNFKQYKSAVLKEIVKLKKDLKSNSR